MIKINSHISDRLDDSVFDFKTIHLSSLVGMQFYFPENWTYEENFDLKKQWILGSDLPFYMLSFTGTPVTKTKLRSYTKMIGKNHPILSTADYIQIEVDFEENKSTFACIIRLNKHNIDYCLKTFCHPSNTLIFCSEQFIFQQDTILSFVKNGLYQDNYWTINYEKMIPLLCEKGTFMFQSLADGGNRIFWRIFAHQSDKEQISQNINTFWSDERIEILKKQYLQPAYENILNTLDQKELDWVVLEQQILLFFDKIRNKSENPYLKANTEGAKILLKSSYFNEEDDFEKNPKMLISALKNIASSYFILYYLHDWQQDIVNAVKKCENIDEIREIFSLFYENWLCHWSERQR